MQVRIVNPSSTHILGILHKLLVMQTQRHIYHPNTFEPPRGPTKDSKTLRPVSKAGQSSLQDAKSGSRYKGTIFYCKFKSPVCRSQFKKFCDGQNSTALIRRKHAPRASAEKKSTQSGNLKACAPLLKAYIEILGLSAPLALYIHLIFLASARLTLTTHWTRHSRRGTRAVARHHLEEGNTIVFLIIQ